MKSIKKKSNQFSLEDVNSIQGIKQLSDPEASTCVGGYRITFSHHDMAGNGVITKSKTYKNLSMKKLHKINETEVNGSRPETLEINADNPNALFILWLETDSSELGYERHITVKANKEYNLFSDGKYHHIDHLYIVSANFI